MLSKCANPECSEQFRYLHQGKLFCLHPTPRIAASTYGSLELLYERFWLCDRCCKEMQVIWDGVKAKVVPLPRRMTAMAVPTGNTKELPRRQLALAANGHE
jgi:hypothetical protein